MGSSGTVIGSRYIVGFSGIERLGVACDVPVALVELNLIWRP